MNTSDFSYQQPIQSMYLSTLNNQKNKRPQTATRDTLKVDDIAGTRAKFIQRPIKPRETYNNRNDDIAKSSPKVLIPTQTNKQCFNMSVDDIQGTRSKLNKFTTTRNTNPLTPQYQIPKVEYYPVQQPKFIRDNMVTYDIEGTSTKQSFAMRLQKEGKVLTTKQQVLKSIQLKRKNNLRTTQNINLLDVSDINLKQNKIKGQRMTNPLDPQYLLPKKDQKGSYIYGQIQKSHPPEQKQKNNNPDFSLLTSDIPGARTKTNNFVMNPKQLIKEAQVNSFKRGLQSNRRTDPLNPNYKYPGCSQSSNNVQKTFQRPKTAHQRFDAFLGK